MNFFKEIKKYNDIISTSMKNSILRRLFVRMIDVEEIYPNIFDGFSDVKRLYMIDFLTDEGDFNYSISCTSDKVILTVVDFRGERPSEEKIKIPAYLLEDNWGDYVEIEINCREIKRMEKEIKNIEFILSNGGEKRNDLLREVKILNDINERLINKTKQS